MPSPQNLERVAALRGRVRMDMRGGGSKSEHQAVLLDSARGSFILRRKLGPAMGDAQLQALSGKTVECDGFLSGSTLLAEKITVID